MFSQLPLNDDLAALFSSCYRTPAKYLVSSPGRVNLIGEHTDYNMLPVLPMTIDRGIDMAVCPHDEPRVELFNSRKEFEPVSFALSENIEPGPPGDWSNYVRAACQGLHPLLAGKNVAMRGFKAAVQSNLPPASGLSSSSALVIASCLALCTSNGIELEKAEMAEMMREAERYVGTAGGGMDQAIILLGQPDSALLIEFDPMSTTRIPVPPGVSIYVIDSGETADKSGSSKLAYNRRSFECAVGVELLRLWAMQQAIPAITEKAVTWNSLRDVFRDLSMAGIPHSAVVLEAAGPESRSLSSLCDVLGVDLVTQLTALKQMPHPSDSYWANTPIAVYNRVSHVFAEAMRVYRFANALEHNRLPEAALLANASHASCRDLYHISTPTIEKLVAKACRSGATAARITGAGFGGSIVAFVPEDKKAGFVETMAAYLVGHGTENLRDTLIECTSVGGARLRVWL